MFSPINSQVSDGFFGHLGGFFATISASKALRPLWSDLCHGGKSPEILGFLCHLEKFQGLQAEILLGHFGSVALTHHLVGGFNMFQPL
jgi:hypothetical protein